ncbi:MAG: hypothetical protein ACLR06_15725 [Christensenellaceae bacterium]
MIDHAYADMDYRGKLIPQADLELRLKAILDKIGKPYDDEAVAAIARAGAGSVRDMLSVADTCVSYSAGRLTYEAVTAVLGSADFSQMRALCAAMLNGESGEALERTEEILAEGKSVGVLLKDVMNFLNACAVAKTCRDAEKILALPADTFSQLAETAKAADGHRLLRVTEIFADTENALRYSVSPRIVFETAVMKASLPQADYNIDSLIARVNELERKLDEGAFSAPKASAAGGAAEKDDAGEKIAEERGRGETTKAEKPAAHPSESTKREAEAYDDYEPPAFDEVPPPDEETTGGNVCFDSAFELKDTSERKAPTVRSPRRTAETPREDPAAPARAATPAKAPVSAPEKPTVRASAVPGDAKATFGSFCGRFEGGEERRSVYHLHGSRQRLRGVGFRALYGERNHLPLADQGGPLFADQTGARGDRDRRLRGASQGQERGRVQQELKRIEGKVSRRENRYQMNGAPFLK